MNSRPLGITMPNGEPTAGGHFLLGCATAKIPQGLFSFNNKLTKRFVEMTVDEWWNN